MSNYKSGTVNTVLGSATVTGILTAWAVNLVTGGVFSCNGEAIPIQGVESDTSLTLAYPWPVASVTGGAYAIALETANAATAVWANQKLVEIVERLDAQTFQTDFVQNFATVATDGETALTALGVGAGGLPIVQAATQRAAMELIVGRGVYNLIEYGADPNFGADVAPILNMLLGDGLLGGDGLGALPYGSTLIIPNGNYLQVTPIRQKRWVDIIWQSGARIQSVTAATTHDQWTIDIIGGGAGWLDAVRGMEFANPYLVNYSGGRHALHITQSVGSLPIFNLNVTPRFLATTEPMVGKQPAALKLSGYDAGTGRNGPTLCTFTGGQIAGGVWLDKVADGNLFTRMNVQGAGATGFTVDTVEGAKETIITGNFITSGQGALDVLNSSDLQFHYNQCEQGGGVTNTLNDIGGLTAQITARGVDRRIQSMTIKNNHFGGGVGLVGAIGVFDNVEDLVWDENHIFQTDSTVDIRLTANSRYCHIGKTILRGPRTTGYPARTDRKLVVQDFGQGNTGFWADTSVYFTSDATTAASMAGCETLLTQEGKLLLAGNVTFGTAPSFFQKLFTLPVDRRPVSAITVAVEIYDVSTGLPHTGAILILSNGDVYLNRVPTVTPDALAIGDFFSLNNIAFAVQARTVYDGGD